MSQPAATELRELRMSEQAQPQAGGNAQEKQASMGRVRDAVKDASRVIAMAKSRHPDSRLSLREPTNDGLAQSCDPPSLPQQPRGTLPAEGQKVKMDDDMDFPRDEKITARGETSGEHRTDFAAKNALISFMREQIRSKEDNHSLVTARIGILESRLRDLEQRHGPLLPFVETVEAKAAGKQCGPRGQIPTENIQLAGTGSR